MSRPEDFYWSESKPQFYDYLDKWVIHMLSICCLIVTTYAYIYLQPVYLIPVTELAMYNYIHFVATWVLISLVNFSLDVVIKKTQILLSNLRRWTEDCLYGVSEMFNFQYKWCHQLGAYFSQKYFTDLVYESKGSKLFVQSIHRSMTHKSLTLTAPSCIDVYRWRCATLLAVDLDKCNVWIADEMYMTPLKWLVEEVSSSVCFYHKLKVVVLPVYTVYLYTVEHSVYTVYLYTVEHSVYTVYLYTVEHSVYTVYLYTVEHSVYTVYLYTVEHSVYTVYLYTVEHSVYTVYLYTVEHSVYTVYLYTVEHSVHTVYLYTVEHCISVHGGALGVHCISVHGGALGVHCISVHGGALGVRD